MNVVIRTDASIKRGSGHVMRCLCLADALKKQGHTVTFASVDLPDYLRLQIEQSGHAVYPLPDQGQGHLASEAAWPEGAQTADATSLAGVFDLAIVDHYGLGPAWEILIRSKVGALVVIDDLGREHLCDLLLDQNYYGDAAGRYAGKLPADCQVLIGPRFALLRPEFAASRRPPQGADVKRLVVFIGGMDASDITSHVLTALDGMTTAQPQIDVIIGASHPNRAGIEARCDSRVGWTCHTQTQRMAELLAEADMVVGAGGTNSWERMAVGVPALALCIADNQRVLLDECASAGLICVPDQSAMADPSILRTHIEAMLHNRRQRLTMALSGLQLVDGRGAERVARALGTLQPVSVRRATSEDRDLLRTWRNHPTVRAVSRSSDVVSEAGHRAWFEKVMADDVRSLLVGERDGVPFGCIRFDEIGADTAEVSIYLSADVFGMGLGRSLLHAGEAWMAKNRPHIARIHAEVLSGNAASAQLFERAGYLPVSSRYTKGLHS